MEDAIRLGGGAFKKECKNMKTLIRNLKEVLERLALKELKLGNFQINCDFKILLGIPILIEILCR